MDYKKELIDSLYLSARLSSYTALVVYLLKKGGLISQPYIKMDLMEILKFSGVLTGAVIADDYAVNNKWYPDKIGK